MVLLGAAEQPQPGGCEDDGLPHPVEDSLLSIVELMRSWLTCVWGLLLAVLAGTAQAGHPRHMREPSRRAVAQVREHVPSALYLIFEGVTLEPCGPQELGNAAKRCTRLVDRKTVFPAFGTSQERTAIVEAVRNHYGAFDLTVWEEQPPSYLPYMAVVVGGTASLVGQKTISCGLAWLSCGGEHRNLVSLVFGSSCEAWSSPVQVASTAAQESAHTLGLEHTTDSEDLMFPTISQTVQSFPDRCSEILTENYDDAYICPDVHVLDCPDGGGGFQNVHAELLRLLGPRRQDDTAPDIVSFSPQPGTAVPMGDAIDISAEIVDDSMRIGVRWTWLDGPDADGFTRCTNDVCDEGYDAWQPASGTWPFFTLQTAMPGHYAFLLEVSDMHGNHGARELVFDVVDEHAEDSGSAGDSSTPAMPPDSEPSGHCTCRAQRAAWGGLPMLLFFMIPRSLGCRRAPKNMTSTSRVRSRSPRAASSDERFGRGVATAIASAFSVAVARGGALESVRGLVEHRARRRNVRPGLLRAALRRTHEVCRRRTQEEPE